MQCVVRFGKVLLLSATEKTSENGCRLQQMLKLLVIEISESFKNALDTGAFLLQLRAT